MSEDEGIGSFTWRIVIGVSVIFACLLVWSLFDLLFLALGSNGQATITEVYAMPARRGADYVHIKYTFPGSDGSEREGTTNLGKGAAAPEVGEVIDIQYLPAWFPTNPNNTRLARPLNWIVLTLLLLSMMGLGFFAYRAIAASGEPLRKPSRRR